MEAQKEYIGMLGFFVVKSPPFKRKLTEVKSFGWLKGKTWHFWACALVWRNDGTDEQRSIREDPPMSR